ncbi:MAG TPA: hypothetical protein PKY87_08105 [Terricaulis sp.]|nr:hypothetical protein [Terricaulis sp.]
MAADILALVPKLRAAAKAMRKGGAPALTVTKAKKVLKAAKPALKKLARKTAKKKAPKKAVKKVARKSSARGR